ncbi:MAG: hypothetical protein U9M94_01220 [Patescibacteria group bacterium]|nr:hypothetical protein [Patescibacteria group bacterium]
MSNITKKMLKLSNSGKTVFSTADLMLLWEIENKNILWVDIFRALKKGYLKHIRRGLYNLGEVEIDKLELAGKLKKNSYISFETVLLKNGIINQWYSTYFSTSDRQADIKNSYGKFKYRKLSEKILNNRLGIINSGNYFIASTERAICDYFYKVGFQQLDDLDDVKKDKLLEISKIYQNKRLERDILKLIALL